jgi:hypothetical protein
VAITFEPATRRIILDSAAASSAELWSAWVDWVAMGDNAKYPPAFRQVGGDELGDGLLIPPYMFLLNSWRVRPMEANHSLVISGNLFVEGGGSPVVNTLGAFNVAIQLTVPVQAQAYATGGVGPSAEDIWQVVLAGFTTEGTAGKVLQQILEIGATSRDYAAEAARNTQPV